MEVSVIIVNYNTSKILKKCITSLVGQNLNGKFEIIVVDNGSSDDSINMINNEFPQIALIQNENNIGFGAANNQGAHIAKGKYLLFLNSDTTLEKNTLNDMIASVQRHKGHKNIGAISFKIMNSNQSLQPSCGNFPTLLNLLIETLFLDRVFKPESSYHILNKKMYQHKFNPDWVSGSCFMVKKRVFNEISGFDKNFFLYVEEVDLCYRIQLKGYNNFFDPIVSVTHNNRASTLSKKPAIVFTHHNLLYFFKKHHNIISTTKLHLLFILKSIVYSILGLLLGFINKEQRDKSRGYLFLFVTLLFKPLYKKYENSFKQ